MRTIAIVNQKGGCGKTTVSINIASALAGFGQRVLLVDQAGVAYVAEYEMIQTAEGWQINGVSIERSPEVGA